MTDFPHVLPLNSIQLFPYDNKTFVKLIIFAHTNIDFSVGYWYTDNTYGVLPALCCVP